MTLTFPSVEDRTPILQMLETTVIAFGTASLDYHLEVTGCHFLRYEAAEDERFICVNVAICVPIAFEFPEKLLEKAVNPET